ncbi:MAG: RNA polymerase sigma factor, partial [Acidobacteriota bacterium]|nr:RNA polymerase sigma factor [Acidobacteriota bacterium]
MYGVARNLIRVVRRKSARSVAGERADPSFEPNVLGALIDGETVAALHAAIRDLPDGYREAVVLCDLEERNYDEAARLAGCPVGTIRSRLHRARGLLAAKLRRLKTPAVAR